MKKIFVSCLILLLNFGLFAQLQSHTNWQFSVKQTGNNEAELISKATIDQGWHLYGQHFPDGGPIRLEFSFEDSPAYRKVGEVLEIPKAQEVMDEIFKIKVQYFTGSATFVQKVKILSPRPFSIKGSLAGQVCLEDGACMKVNEDFEFKLPGATVAVAIPSTEKPIQTTKTPEIAVPIKADTIKTLTITEPIKPVSSNATDKPEKTAGNSSLLWFFWFSFLAGLLAILTPCVFPMIPMTVSFFMHGGKNKTKARFEALFYGISIVFIYTVIGTLVAFTLGPSFANFLSTHWLPNIFFFLIFLFFAASFFGMFEIVLPSWMVNKADQQVYKGGICGPFFMAFTLVLVSFSCTGPIV